MPQIKSAAVKKPQQVEQPAEAVEPKVQNESAPVKEASKQLNPKYVKTNKSNNKTKGPKHIKGKETVPENISKEQANLVMLIRNNQAIRRYTSLYILHRFEEDGFIDQAKGGYVDFYWDKFKVTDSKKLSKEYAYNEPFLITAVAFAHSRMMNDSQRILEEFATLEDVDIENVDVTKVKI